MKILWASNAPWVSSGYGVQTALFARRLKTPPARIVRAVGSPPPSAHEVAIAANHGLEDGVLNWHDGIPIFPASKGSWGHRYTRAHAEVCGADIVITLADVWNMNAEDMARVAWCPWVPIDSEPLSPAIRSILAVAFQPIAFSRFGERMMQDAGLTPAYVPLGIGTNVLKPGDKRQAREKLGLPASAFVVGIVAANVDNPSRKALPEQLAAFARFKRKHSDAVLYLHSQPADSPSATGVSLPPLLAEIGLEIGRDVFFPDRYRHEVIGFPPQYMATAYQAMDVLLSVTCGEGFGVPIVEAQACSIPVIVGDWTSMGELCFGGWKVPKDEAQQFRMPQGNWSYVPRIGAIAERLEYAYKKADQESEKARAGAQSYDADRIVERYWRPVLDDIAARLADERAHPSPCQGRHRFGTLGVTTVDGVTAVPCQVTACAANRRLVGGRWIDMERGMGMELGGVRLDIEEPAPGGVAKTVLAEIFGTYGLHEIEFRPGDVVIDVGAHVGVVSIWLAKKYPFLKILAFEPWAENFRHLIHNIEANGVGEQVTASPLAVTGDGAHVLLSKSGISGDVSAFTRPVNEAAFSSTRSVTLAAILDEHGIDRVRLLKMDCEGEEYGIVEQSAAALARVDYFRAEVHASDALSEVGCAPDKMVTMLTERMPGERGRWKFHACAIG